MREERQLVLDDALNYVFLLLRNRPEVSLGRMREIAAEVSGIEDRASMDEAIFRLAGVQATEPDPRVRV